MSTIFTIIFSLLGYLPRTLVQFVLRRTMYKRRSLWLNLTSVSAKSIRPGTAVWQTLESMTRDDELRTLVITLHSLPTGWSTLQAFREILLAIKKSGKTLFFHIYTPDMRALYLASVGDKTWIRPSGEVFWTGLGGRHTFYGALFEKLGIQADIEAAGDYKSFGEPYTRSSASKANREQLLSLYGNLQSQILQDISETTGISVEDLSALSEQSPLEPERLVDLGLIEGPLYEDELAEHVKKFTLASTDGISFETYHRLDSWIRFWNSWGDIRPKIAVIHLSGAIVENTENAPGIEAEEVVQVMQEFAHLESIKAVVLSVNSPGGSATASDRIARGVQRLRMEKPVVVHFGNVAASGGYYLSAFAHEIIAQPASITGSIGVVGGKLVVGEGLQRLGINGEVIAVGGDTEMFDVWSPFNDSQRHRFRSFLSRTYDRFVTVVSNGRMIPREAIEAAAKGRVWTGQQALDLGLVDRLGSLRSAIDRASIRAGLNPNFVAVVNWRKKISLRRRLQQQMSRTERSGLVDMALQDSSLLLREINRNPMQALLVLPVDVGDYE